MTESTQPDESRPQKQETENEETNKEETSSSNEVSNNETENEETNKETNQEPSNKESSQSKSPVSDHEESPERESKDSHSSSEDSPSNYGTKRIFDELEEEEEANKREIRRIKKERMAQMKEEIARLKKKREANCAVFVSGLPEDCTKDEVLDAFGKYGVLSEDLESGEARIKMYMEEEKFKGEALVFYERADSVPLAIQMMHESQFRPGVTIQVQEAEFGERKEGKKLTEEQKKRLKIKKEALRAKLDGWDEDERLNEAKKKILDKIVVVQQMFRVQELHADPVLEMDIKQDIQEECDRLGIGNDVTKIALDGTSGSVTIKFKSASSGEVCVRNFDGRWFDGLRLSAKRESD